MDSLNVDGDCQEAAAALKRATTAAAKAVKKMHRMENGLEVERKKLDAQRKRVVQQQRISSKSIVEAFHHISRLYTPHCHLDMCMCL